MNIGKIEGMIYCAYGVDISESKNIRLLEEIFENDFELMSQEEIDEYQHKLKKEKAGDVLPWLDSHTGGIDETFCYFFESNKELNPYNLFIDYWNNKIFYGPSYPWDREKEKDITKQQVEETLQKIADAFGVELK